MTDRIPKERAVCVCLDGGRVLVMRRYRDGRRYAVLPGGGIEVGESPRDAAVRELAEETGLAGTVVGDLAVIDHEDRRAHYFRVRVAPREPALGGLESETQDDDDRHDPAWVDVADLDAEGLVPAEARDLVAETHRRERGAAPA